MQELISPVRVDMAPGSRRRPAPARHRIYLDWNASAPLAPEARSAMIETMARIGNPSSVHGEGRAARSIVEHARRQVAQLVGADADDIVFTSGATEANQMVLAGGWDRVMLAGIEHESVWAAAAGCGAHVIELATDPAGRIVVEALEEAMARQGRAPGRALLTVQAANNETGVVQALAPVFALARAHGVAAHCDAVQIPGRLPLGIASMGADFVSLSAHKMGGPTGVGALVCRPEADLRPLIRGGGQQRGRRAGTENVSGVAGFGAAAEMLCARGEERRLYMLRLRERLESRLLEITPDAIVVAHKAERLPNTTCIARPGRSAETLVIEFDLKGIAISAGSACSSGKVAASRILSAIGLPPELVRSAVRFSLGPTTTEADIDAACDVWAELGRGGRARHDPYRGREAETGAEPARKVTGGRAGRGA